MQRTVRTAVIVLVTVLSSTCLAQAAQAQGLFGWLVPQPVNVAVDVTNESGELVQIYSWDGRQHLVTLAVGGQSRIFVPEGDILLQAWLSESRTWQPLHIRSHVPFRWEIKGIKPPPPPPPPGQARLAIKIEVTVSNESNEQVEIRQRSTANYLEKLQPGQRAKITIAMDDVLYADLLQSEIRLSIEVHENTPRQFQWRIPPVLTAVDEQAGGVMFEADAKAEPRAVGAGREYVVEAPIRHANLAIFPVLSATARQQDRFITLDEGLQAGTVKVSEVEEGREVGVVNRLIVLNSSDSELYLMPGETILGGRQDRTLAREMIIPPGTEPVPVEVYCVEPGRWGRRTAQQYTALAALLRDGRQDSQFVDTAGAVTTRLRRSVHEGREQREVWETVRRVNTTTGVHTDSGAFTANYAATSVTDKLAPYLEKLQQPVAAQERIVGVVVAINGKTESADLFESTPLFCKLWPKLLKGFALDAASAQEPTTAQKICTVLEATEFLEKAMQAEVQSTQRGAGLVFTTRSTDGVMAFSATPEDAADGVAAGTARPVHLAVFAG